MKLPGIAAIIIASVALGAGAVNAKGQSVAGTWTFTIEQAGLQLVLDQRDTAVTGTLAWPHGTPLTLTGRLSGDTLTFSGDSSGENFTVHVVSTGSLKKDGTLAGTLKAHFVDFNDAHQVVRTWDQEIPWTATRGLHGVVRSNR